MERRCWTKILRDPIYPNLFVWLVGIPGTGKSVGISVVQRMIRNCREFKVAPHRITRAGLEDALLEARKMIKEPGTTMPEPVHFMLAMVPELGNFIPSHDTEYLNVLTDGS